MEEEEEKKLVVERIRGSRVCGDRVYSGDIGVFGSVVFVYY